MPEWKKKLVMKSRIMYENNTRFIDDWIKKYDMRSRNMLHQKFEWNCGTDCSSIKDGIIQIKYPTGEMNLVIDRFFPATQERVKLVLRLMRDYSPPEDQMEVYSYLSKRLSEFEQMMSFYGQIVATGVKRKELREAAEGLRKSRTMFRRTKKNMELLLTITGLEVCE